jgi:hypothetical protein
VTYHFFWGWRTSSVCSSMCGSRRVQPQGRSAAPKHRWGGVETKTLPSVLRAISVIVPSS